ncbi:MAG: CvpA family protein [Candidatus Omnitrophica bacterium]|nr:CvpA family protein [Candidatus Omnitrophota bacterium]
MSFSTMIPAQLELEWLALWFKMGWLDVVFLIVFGFGVFLGLRKGLAKTLPGLIEVVIVQTVTIEYGLAIAQRLYVKLQVIPLEALHIVLFASLALGLIVLLRLMFQMLALVASVEFKPPINNVGAAVVGGVQFVLYLGLLASFLTLLPLPFIQQTFSGTSISGPFLAELSQSVHDFFVRWLPTTWQIR